MIAASVSIKSSQKLKKILEVSQFLNMCVFIKIHHTKHFFLTVQEQVPRAVPGQLCERVGVSRLHVRTTIRGLTAGNLISLTVYCHDTEQDWSVSVRATARWRKLLRKEAQRDTEE